MLPSASVMKILGKHLNKLNLIQDGLFGTAHGWGRGKKAPPL